MMAERVPCHQGGVTAAGPSPNLTEFPIKHLKISRIFLNPRHLNLCNTDKNIWAISQAILFWILSNGVAPNEGFEGSRIPGVK